MTSVRSKLFLSSGVVLLSTLAASACSDEFEACDKSSTCSPTGGTSAGVSGKSGTSGSTTGGKSTASPFFTHRSPTSARLNPVALGPVVAAAAQVHEFESRVHRWYAL